MGKNMIFKILIKLVSFWDSIIGKVFVSGIFSRFESN